MRYYSIFFVFLTCFSTSKNLVDLFLLQLELISAWFVLVQAAQRASRNPYDGERVINYTELKEIAAKEYRAQQIAPVEIRLETGEPSSRCIAPLATQFGSPSKDCRATNSPRTPLDSLVRHITWPLSSREVPVQSTFTLRSTSNVDVETPGHEVLNSTAMIVESFACNRPKPPFPSSAMVHRQGFHSKPPEKSKLTSIPENHFVHEGVQESTRGHVRPYGQSRRVPPQFIKSNRTMNRSNPYYCTPEDVLLQKEAAVTKGLIHSLVNQDPGSSEHTNSLCDIFSSDEELLNLDLDDLSRMSSDPKRPQRLVPSQAPVSTIATPLVVAAAASTVIGAASHHVVAPVSVPIVSPSDQCPPSKVVAYNSTFDTRHESLPVSATAPVPIPVAGPFTNVTHVNFLFAKDMDFGSLLAALGKPPT